MDEEQLVSEMLEYESVERIKEEKGQTGMKQTQPFPVEVELRHHTIEDHNLPAGRLTRQTIQVYRPTRHQEQPEEFFKDVDIRGITKIACDGTNKKISKNQTLRITNHQMVIKSEKGTVEDVLVDCLSQITYKQASKKEITITTTSEDTSKVYKLQFESTKDLNVALIDLGRCGMLNNEEKSQIKHKLLKLLGKRSSKDLLEKKGIIRNEPIFGNTLRHLYESNKRPVPEFVTRILPLIELPRNIKSVGLYRASGNLATIQKIRFHIDKNNLKILDEYRNEIDVLTGSLKLFFRELKEPLIPYRIYEELSKYIATDTTELDAKTIENIKQLMSNKLDTAHRQTFSTLMDHLLRVESHNDDNRMDAYNISIVWGPTLIWPPDNCHENILQSHTNANRAIELLLNVYKKTNDKDSSSPQQQQQQKNESSRKISCNDDKKEHGYHDDHDTNTQPGKLNRHALVSQLNEMHSLRRAGSKENLMRSTESLTKLKDDGPRSPDVKLDLEQLCANTKDGIPEFVTKVVPLIERGINMENLYRKDGSTDKLEKIRKKMGVKNRSNLSSMDKYNVHDLASALKSFFLELRTPIIPKDVFERLVLASEARIEVTKLRNVKRELNNCHVPCRETLDYIFRHLVNVSRHEESNKMSKHNIATEWAPYLCCRFVESNEISVGCCVQVIDALLQIYDVGTEPLERDDLGRSPDKSEGHVTTLGLPPLFKRKSKLIKSNPSFNASSSSKLAPKPVSFYENVHGAYAEDIRNEATVLETTTGTRKSTEDRTKL